MKKLLKVFIVLTVLGVMFMAGCSKAREVNPKLNMYRANPQHTGVFDTKGVPQLSGLKWKFKTESIMFSSPVIADGVVYVGSREGYLFAVDLKTGKEKWKFKTASMIFSSPAIADGVVYVGSTDGFLYAVK